MARTSKQSREYWRDREIEHAKQRIKEEKEIIKKLAQLNNSASAEIEKNVSYMLERYAEKNELTMAEVQKRLTAFDIRDFEAKAAQYVREKDLSDRANREMAIYNLKMKSSRLDLINAHINLEASALTGEVEKVVANGLAELARSEAARQSGILGQAIILDAKGVEFIATRQFQGDDFSDRLWKNKQLLHSELQKRLNESIRTGQGAKDAARKLRKTVEQSKFNAERLMITESARVQSEVQKESFAQADIDQYEFIATEEACKVCTPLDGDIFNVADARPGKNMAPMHPFCKCSAAPYVE